MLEFGVLLELAVLFLVCFLTPNLNFIIPVRPTILTIVLARDINWAAVGLVAAVGGVLGVLPLYGIAYKATDTKRVQRWLRLRWVQWILVKLRRRLFLLMVLLVVTPLPDQLIGITAGAERYGVRRFMAANFIGRVLIYLPLAYAASQNAAGLNQAWSWVVQLVTF